MKNINTFLRAFDWIELVSSVLIIICFFLPYYGEFTPVAFLINGFMGFELMIFTFLGLPMFFFLFFPLLIYFSKQARIEVPRIFLIIIFFLYYSFFLIKLVPDEDLASLLISFLISLIIFITGLLNKDRIIFYKGFILSVLSIPVILYFIDLKADLAVFGMIFSICMLLIIITYFLRIVLNRNSEELTA
jgi:hypothetical protein